MELETDANDTMDFGMLADALLLAATKKVSESAALFLTSITILLIFIATLGNAFTIYVIVTQREMRSAKYGFILNLAVSDLLLCLFTQPFNLVLTLERTWRFGVFLCQFITMCQGTSVFASSFSITAIAVDRLHVVMRRRAESRMEKKRVMPSIIFIWLTSVTLALPCYFFSELKPFELASVSKEQIEAVSSSLGINMDMCKSRQEEVYVKLAAFYSLFCLIVQFLINFLIISGTHCFIWIKVIQRRKKMAQSRSQAHRPAPVKRVSATRRKKAKYLLICITVTFVISWLPLNILNLALDFTDDTNNTDTTLPYASPMQDSLSLLASQTDSSTWKTQSEEQCNSSTSVNISETCRETAGAKDDMQEEKNAEAFTATSSLQDYEVASANVSTTESSELHSITDLLFPAANVLSLLSAVLNPIYYGWFNHRFRLHFLKCISYVIGRPLTTERGTGATHRSVSDEAAHSRAHTNVVHSPRSTCATALHASATRENGLTVSTTAVANGSANAAGSDAHTLHAPTPQYVKQTHPSKVLPCTVCTKRAERIALTDVGDLDALEANGNQTQVRIVIESGDWHTTENESALEHAHTHSP